MKQLVEVIEVEGEGLASLLGKRVLLLCSAYFYHGLLVGVNEQFVKLEKASIVYSTGAWDAPTFSDAQTLGSLPHYVMIQSIESFREDNRPLP